MIFQTSLLVGYVSIPWRVSAIDLDVSENGGFSPQIIHFKRVFHYFHHAILGNSLFSETPIWGLQ